MNVFGVVGAGLLAVFLQAGAEAQTPVKVGVLAEMSGEQAEYGLQMTRGMKVFLDEHGGKAAGRPIDLVVKDVGGPNPELAKRLGQELVVQDKVDFLTGFGFSPNAFAVAPLATEAKTPMVIMNAVTSTLPSKSPYIIRVSNTLGQHALGIAQWALKDGVKSVYTLYADYAPGRDASAQFEKAFTAGGGTIAGKIGIPLKNPDFGPYMQRVKDAKPDAVLLWFPSGELSTALLHAYRERGLEQAGIKLLGMSDLVDDTFVTAMGKDALGVVTSAHYSAAHDSQKNKDFIKRYYALFGDKTRPNFMAVAGYDGMAAIAGAIEAVDGKLDPAKEMEFLSHLKLESPRGPIAIDPATRDIVQDIYLRKTEARGDQLYNVEFATIPAVKDPK